MRSASQAILPNMRAHRYANVEFGLDDRIKRYEANPKSMQCSHQAREPCTLGSTNKTDGYSTYAQNLPYSKIYPADHHEKIKLSIITVGVARWRGLRRPYL